MENILSSIGITLPLILMLLLGMLLRRLKMTTSEFIRVANKLNFNVFLPASVFAGIYCAEYNLSECISLIEMVVITLIIMFVASVFLSMLMTKNKSHRATMISGMFRSNYAYVGVPVVCAIVGVSSSLFASLTLAVCSMVNNVLSPLGFSINSGEKLSVKKILKDVFGNVYLIVTIIAVVLMLLHCPKFPEPIHKTISSLGSVCTPLAVVVLGANLDLGAIGPKRRLLRWCNLFKLVIFPLIGTFIFVKMGLTGEKLAVMFALLGCPTATLLFTISQEMGGDTDLATEIVAIGTCVSMITMTVGIYILKTLGLL